jgi:5-deoxy-glucuronate isomerase
VHITPESAGWAECSLQVVDLDDAGSVTLRTGDTEVMILPLAGGGTVDCVASPSNCRRAHIGFRRSRRHGLPRRRADLHAGRARSHRDLRGTGEQPVPQPPGLRAQVPVELRGAGNCSRQVHNFGTADTFEADSLIACEVITPGGNGPAIRHTSTMRTPRS